MDIAVDPTWRVEIVAGEAPRRGPRWGIGRRRAMVVDATPGGLEVAEALGAVDGFAVDVCESVSVAVERRWSAPADVLVLDPQACGHQASVAMRLWASAYADDPPPVVWCTSALPTPPELRNAVVDGLRAVVVKPLRAQTVADLVVRSCRSHEREVRLRAGGVGVEDLCALLSVETTLRWIQVESELANAHRRPLSVVAVGALTPAVAGTVRRALRPADTLGRRDPRTLLVLLPDVELDGAAAVAQRLELVLGGFVPQPAAVAVTRRSGEGASALLDRTARELVDRTAVGV